MNFELSDDQQLFREVIRNFVDTHIRPVARDSEHANRYPAEIVEVMKQMGLFGMLIPAEYGGQGLDVVSMSIVFEEISKSWMGVAGILGSHTLGLPHDRSARHPGSEGPLSFGSGYRRAAYRHWPHRAGRRQRPTGHHHKGEARR